MKCVDCGKEFTTTVGEETLCLRCWAKSNPSGDMVGSYESNPLPSESVRRIAAMEKIADSLARTAAVQEKSWGLIEKFLPLMERVFVKMQKDAEKWEDR